MMTNPRERFRLPARLVLCAAAAVTAGVSLWLFTVCATVLPARDPAHIPFWRAVALSFVAYSALCWAYALSPSRGRLFRWIILGASSGAVLAGAYGIVNMLVRTDAGGHFEGYIILMGLILGGHGLAAISYALLSRPSVRGAG
jgi:hypothetical protein